MRRNFARAAATFEQGDALHREVGARMQERLDYIKLDVHSVLDLAARVAVRSMACVPAIRVPV